MAGPVEVIGWRIYALSDEGRLIPPWATKIWSDRLTDTDPASPAVCLGQPWHDAPAPGCTCGYRATVDLAELIGYGTRRYPQHWPVGMLPACGVLARVRLLPPHRPGSDMPWDDPATTWRGAGVELLELHVGATTPEMAVSLREVYGCEVALYAGKRWWQGVVPLTPAA